MQSFTSPQGGFAGVQPPQRVVITFFPRNNLNIYIYLNVLALIWHFFCTFFLSGSPSLQVGNGFYEALLYKSGEPHEITDFFQNKGEEKLPWSLHTPEARNRDSGWEYGI